MNHFVFTLLFSGGKGGGGGIGMGEREGKAYMFLPRVQYDINDSDEVVRRDRKVGYT